MAAVSSAGPPATLSASLPPPPPRPLCYRTRFNGRCRLNPDGPGDDGLGHALN